MILTEPFTIKNKKMRSIIMITVSVLSLLNLNASAQTEKLRQALGKGLQQLGTAKNADDFSATANYFERIAQAESKQWLPLYYAAYSNLLAGITNSSKSAKDQYCDKALLQIEQAGLLSADNSEVFALTGYIQFMKMSVDPQGRMNLIGQSTASLDKAKALNPDNPRPYFIQGQSVFYTPETFGGGKAAAKPVLSIAVDKFKTFKPENSLSPNWGAERAAMLLNECK